MSGPSAKTKLLLGAAGRLAVVLVVAFLIGSILTRLALRSQADATPAGFGRGVLQGALMPMAFPNLLLGRDIPIYAENNQGIRYKLGYTAGVNACGALFFGFLFYRLQKMRRRV